MSIQEILEDHLRVKGVRGLETLCICGWHTAQRLRPEDLHRAHLAEVLDKHMQERAVQAQVNMLNGVASAWEEMTLPGAHHLYARILRETASRIGTEPTNGR